MQITAVQIHWATLPGMCSVQTGKADLWTNIRGDKKHALVLVSSVRYMKVHQEAATVVQVCSMQEHLTV
jgi:hypothetical protein